MVTLEVTGMVCDGCAAAVARALNQQDATAIVRVSRERGRLDAETRLSPEQAIAAIEAAGYEARQARD